MKLSLCPRPPAMKRFSTQVGALIIFAKYTVDTLLPGNEDKHRKCMGETAAGGTSGTPAMAQSAAYPDELAAVIVQMWSQREPAIKPRSTSTHAQKEPRPEGSPQSSSASGAWGSDPESDTSAHGIRAGAWRRGNQAAGKEGTECRFPKRMQGDAEGASGQSRPPDKSCEGAAGGRAHAGQVFPRWPLVF